MAIQDVYFIKSGVSGWQQVNHTGLLFSNDGNNLGISGNLTIVGNLVWTGLSAVSLTGDINIGSSTIRKNSTYTIPSSYGLSIISAANDTQLLIGADGTNNISYIQSQQSGTSVSAGFPLSLNPTGGRVGINTLNPGFSLDVSGTLGASGAAYFAQGVSIYNTGEHNYSLIVGDTAEPDGSSFFIDASGNIYHGQNIPNGKVTFYGNAVTRYVAVNSVFGLTVRCDDNNNVSGLVLQNRDIATVANQGIHILFQVADDSSTLNLSAGRIATLKQNVWNSGVTASRNSYMTFETSSGSTVAERARIDSSGRLGLGTTLPQERFHNAFGTMLSGRFFAPGNNSHQTLSAGTTLAINGTHKIIVSGNGAPITSTATPALPTGGFDGQLVYLFGADDTNTVTFQREASLSGTRLRLGAATRVLGQDDTLTLMYNSATNFWCEQRYVDNA